MCHILERVGRLPTQWRVKISFGPFGPNVFYILKGCKVIKNGCCIYNGGHGKVCFGPFGLNWFHIISNLPAAFKSSI